MRVLRARQRRNASPAAAARARPSSRRWKTGYCDTGQDITVKVPGGDLIVSYTPDGVTLTGETALAFEGVVVC